jgi:hypothetical protein
MKLGSKKNGAGRRRDLSVSGSPDQDFHLLQITLQGSTTGRRESKLGVWESAGKSLCATDVSGFLELAGVDAQVAVGRFDELLQFIEAQDVVDRQGADDPQSEPLMDNAVE